MVKRWSLSSDIDANRQVVAETITTIKAITRLPEFPLPPETTKTIIKEQAKKQTTIINAHKNKNKRGKNNNKSRH